MFKRNMIWVTTTPPTSVENNIFFSETLPYPSHPMTDCC